MQRSGIDTIKYHITSDPGYNWSMAESVCKLIDDLLYYTILHLIVNRNKDGAVWGHKLICTDA